MIELLLFALAFGAGGLANNNSSKKSAKSDRLPGKQNPDLDSRTFLHMTSGYDPVRNVSWTRKDKWHIDEL